MHTSWCVSSSVTAEAADDGDDAADDGDDAADDGDGDGDDDSDADFGAAAVFGAADDDEQTDAVRS